MAQGENENVRMDVKGGEGKSRREKCRALCQKRAEQEREEDGFELFF